MYERISVYIVAHQDDWQLFMDPDIGADLDDPKCRTIIIYTTAGDAGEGAKYWRARESGAINSLLFRISVGPGFNVARKTMSIDGKRVFRVDTANCSSYFLRLPDGGPYGDGFERYGYQSISKIRLNQVNEVVTVDLKNTFRHFGEISGLMNEIIRKEQKAYQIMSAGDIRLNFPEYDSALNPGDHCDHFNTAMLVTGMDLYGAVPKRTFVHYHIQHTADDLAGTALFWKVGMFSVYHQTVMEKHGHSTISETPAYSVWCRKNAVYRELN